MKSIETLDKIKDKLTQDEYDTIANDLRLLAKNLVFVYMYK